MAEEIGRETKTLEGTVDSVTVRKEDTGFTVLEIESGGYLYTVVGVLPEVFEGEQLVLTGTWQSHSTYGEQFRAETCERYLPATASALLRYLSSGAVKGIGPATASRIVETFGDSTLEVIEKDPDRLAQVKGISKSKAHQISEQFALQSGMREAMLQMSALGLSPTEAITVWKKWGVSSMDLIRATPYLLCTNDIGIDFRRADAIAEHLACPHDDDFRILAGIRYILEHNTLNGHTCLPFDKLRDVSAQLLKIEPETIERHIEAAVDDRELAADTIDDRRFVFLNDLYEAEIYCAAHLTMLSKFPPEPVRNYQQQVMLCEALSGITYNEKQKEAIDAAMSRGALVLTGGPGTGKTTTLNAIIDTFEAAGKNVAIAAPTGRAAKRITEITGREAKTIHRLLEVEWGENDVQVFKRNAKNKLDCDVLVVDEVSMLDVLLFSNLLRALNRKCRLILVGDSDQLPSVGAGNVMADLIASKCLPAAQLTEVFRQAQESAIVRSAHRIVRGEMPELEEKTSDFFFIESDNESAVAGTIVDLCYRRLPNAYGFDPMKEIQVLCPSKIGACGVHELNRRFQERFNPKNDGKREITVNATVFREGDKVMQIKNNYDVEWFKDDGTEGTGVFNGDVGILEKVSKLEGEFRVRFDDRTAVYSTDSVQELEHAYAMTVHKSQGSEFEAVIMPVMPGTPKLFYRNLLYTAVTRAKKIMILIGRRDVIAAMVKNVKKTGRYTALRTFLIDENRRSVQDEDEEEEENLILESE